MTVDMTRDGAAAAPLRLRDPAELLVAIPVLLGFCPGESIVLICLGGPRGRSVGLTIRVDLPPPEDLPMLAAQLVGTVTSRATRQVLLALVCSGDPAGPPRRDVADYLRAALDAAGVEIVARAWAAELASGAAWACYDDCGCAGLLADPASSEVAAAAVAAGQVTFADRAELIRLVAPTDAAALDRRAARLTAAIDAAVLDDSLAGDAARARDLAAVRAALADVAAGRLVLGDDDVVRLAAALSDVRVRDACIALTLDADLTGEGPAAVEQLWAALARETPDPEAAEPATLLAVAAFLRGHGGLANVALERAQRAWPGHRLSALLDAAIAGGLSPSEVRAALGGC